MRPILLLARDCITYWMNVWVAPVEWAYDLIESELESEGSPAPAPPEASELFCRNGGHAS